MIKQHSLLEHKCDYCGETCNSMYSVFVNGTYYNGHKYCLMLLNNELSKKCINCSYLNSKNFSNSVYVGRCSLTNLKKYKDDSCNKFKKKDVK